MNITEEENFYNTVADLLECENHNYKPFQYIKRTRWNNRDAGNGRYLGFGIVRRYSSEKILVQLHTPPVIGLFSSAQDAYEAIKKSR